MSQKYLGVKLIEAEPMTYYDFAMERYGEVRQDARQSEGYKVTYEDDYVSFSPKEVFEKAYRPTTGLNFALAIEAMRRGNKVARSGWNGKGMWCELQVPDDYSKMTRPYIFMTLPKGSTNHFGAQTKDFERVPWLPSQTDIFADDWQIVE